MPAVTPHLDPAHLELALDQALLIPATVSKQRNSSSNAQGVACKQCKRSCLGIPLLKRPYLVHSGITVIILDLKA